MKLSDTYSHQAKAKHLTGSANIDTIIDWPETPIDEPGTGSVPKKTDNIQPKATSKRYATHLTDK